MNRRGFLSTLVGGVAIGAAARSWPFRVFSFPVEFQPALPFAVSMASNGLYVFTSLGASRINFINLKTWGTTYDKLPADLRNDRAFLQFVRTKRNEILNTPPVEKALDWKVRPRETVEGLIFNLRVTNQRIRDDFYE